MSLPLLSQAFSNIVQSQEVVVQSGVLLLLLGLVHAGIHLQRADTGNLTAVVIPVRTAFVLTTGAGLVAFGLTLSS